MTGRLESLDVFRGTTIAAMMLVNNPGASEAVHAPLASPVNASLLYAVRFVLLLYAVAWIMRRRGWFLKV